MDSEKLYTSNSDLKTAVIHVDYDVSYDEKLAGSLKGGLSFASTTESDIVYPSTIQVLFVTACLAIAIFLVGLDRTIVAAAT